MAAPHESSRTVLITGASSGLGAEFARQLARQDVSLILVARREENLLSLAAELTSSNSAGPQAEILVADLTVADDLTRVCERLRACDSLAGLINNAGFGTKPRFLDANDAALAQQDAMLSLHCHAVTHLTQAAMPNLMRCANELPATPDANAMPFIINVSSVAGFFQRSHNVMYCATKAWLTSFTRGIAMELAEANCPLRIQALCPGLTHTGFHAAMGSGVADKSLAPPHWWLPAETVVAASLRALTQNQLICIPGWRYKLLALMSKLLPLGLQHRLSRHANKKQTQRRKSL